METILSHLQWLIFVIIKATWWAIFYWIVDKWYINKNPQKQSASSSLMLIIFIGTLGNKIGTLGNTLLFPVMDVKDILENAGFNNIQVNLIYYGTNILSPILGIKTYQLIKRR